MTTDSLEKIIRPIVEGQIRGFLKEHPKIVEAVDWYKPRKDKVTTFTNSLSKRIVRDLTCPTTRARLEVAVNAEAMGRSRVSKKANRCYQKRPAKTKAQTGVACAALVPNDGPSLRMNTKGRSCQLRNGK